MADQLTPADILAAELLDWFGADVADARLRYARDALRRLEHHGYVIVPAEEYRRGCSEM